LRHFCSPHQADSAPYPFIAQLERAADFVRDDRVVALIASLDDLVCFLTTAQTWITTGRVCQRL
jgi:hypothetical protein